MRRGRILAGIAPLVAACFLGGAPPAAAATPQEMCADIADGHVDGTYTNAEWDAFFSDPTIQGYGCNGVVPPPAPAAPPAAQQSAPATQPAQGAGPVTSGAVPLSPSVPQVAPPAQLPAVTAGVAGARKTIVATAKPARTAGVLGAKSPSRSAAAPLTATAKRGTLPFTGAELGVFAVVGLALIGSGLLLRTTSRRRSSE
jgi:hypothetical protein